MTLPVNLRTHAARKSAERLADKYLADNDNTPPKGRTPVYRGGRPAMNWAAKHDQVAAACLWLIARQRLPDSVVVANDNEPVNGGLDVRRNGAARGRSRPRTNLGEHLDLPAILPRLGDEPPSIVQPAGHTRVDIRPQNDICELSEEFQSFGACADGLAEGVVFIGAESGLGTPRPGKSRGSPLKAEEPQWSEPPPEVDYVLELMLAGEDLAGIGRAFGAKGRYQDKKGKVMLSKAMTWAKERVAETNYRPMLQIA